MRPLSGRRAFRVLSSRRAWRGRFIEARVDRVRYPSGRVHTRDIILHPGAVVLAARLARDRWVLVRQYRHAARDLLWEFPAGKIDRGESAARCARRELAEEIGYLPKRLKRLVTFYPSPGVLTERMHLYLAQDLVKKTPLLDDDEINAVRVLPLAKLERLASGGRIRDGKTLLAIYFLLSHRRQLGLGR